MNRKRSLALLIIWMIVIFVFSQMDDSISEALSQSATSFLLNLKNLLLIKEFDPYIRKIAHVFEYFILGGLAYNYFRFIFNDRKVYIYSFILSFIYACSDEIHQLFIQGRAGQMVDVFIDMIGVFIILVILFIKNRYASKRKSS